LRRQSLFADAVSHAALPGIVVVFIFFGVKDTLSLSLGAAVAGWIGALAVLAIVRASRVPFDSALALVLSVFFGIGLLLMTAIQKNATARQADLERYLWGQAATLRMEDVRAILYLGGLAVLVLIAFWKEFQLLAFDPGYAAGSGLPVVLLDSGLMLLLVVAVVLGLQAVGVVLMSSLVVAPAVAARPWCATLKTTVMLAGAIGGFSGVAGAMLGHALAAPTGPVIVLVVSTCVAISLALSRVRKVLRGPA
jgi:manganese/zinc/iron transport system permease protein